MVLQEPAVDAAAFIQAAGEGNQGRLNGFLARMDRSCEFRATGDFRVLALHAAAEGGHLEMVRGLLYHFPHILLHDRDELGRTLLHVAARGGQEQLVRVLKREHEQRVEVNARAKGEMTALHLAAHGGHAAVVEMLLSWWEVDLDAVSGEKLTALHMAADGGHEQVVRMLLAACRLRDSGRVRGFVNARDCLWRTPLHYACRGGHAGAARELLAAPEVNVNAVDCVCELTPLHLAAWMGDHFEVVRLLLMQDAVQANARIGSAVNCVNGQLVAEVLVAQVQAKGEVPWEELPRPDMRDRVRGYDCVAWTQGRGQVKAAREGGTALHIAAQESHVGSVLEILKHGKADVNAGDGSGMTALHYAAAMGNTAVVKALVKDVRVNLNAGAGGRFSGQTPLQMAVQAERVEVVKELCGQGRLRANARDGKDRTALHMVWERDGDGAEDVKEILMRREDVRMEMRSLQQDRSVYRNAANALLIGGALVAGCTFGSWLQPPLGSVPYYQYPRRDQDPLAPPDAFESFAAVEYHPAVRIFWIFNSLSFYFAVFTLLSGIQIMLPKAVAFIGDEVEMLRRLITRTSASLLVAVALIVAGFASAGFTDLPPPLRFQADMIVTTALGLGLCVPFVMIPLCVSIFRFFKDGWKRHRRSEEQINNARQFGGACLSW